MADLAPNPVVLSARHDDDLDGLESELLDTLPPLERAELTLPLSDEAMSLLSWLHDQAVEVDVTYESDRAVVDLRARPATVEQARSRIEELQATA
ncbi:hypothetical protein BRC65_02200 [Halobacteriales archaeon QH_2_65_14]|nr:MAG: hypothetical protein BRC65_02200 [Halobacteriales archaeon QH_2_65_14]